MITHAELISDMVRDRMVSALFKAVAECNLEEIRDLVTHGADVNSYKNQYTPLMYAVKDHQQPSGKSPATLAVEHILGGKPDADTIRGKSAQVVALLLELGADPLIFRPGLPDATALNLAKLTRNHESAALMEQHLLQLAANAAPVMAAIEPALNQRQRL